MGRCLFYKKTNTNTPLVFSLTLPIPFAALTSTTMHVKRQPPENLNPAELEQHWAQTWEAEGLHHYDPARGRDDTFVVDSPPPTISGELHMGHVFSYTHQDVIVRYQRLRGKNIFYPMGWDDNGLPTERRVQNVFGVRCEPHIPYEGAAAMAGLVDRKALDDKARKEQLPVSRQAFIKLCEALTVEDETVFKAMWQRLGLSIDWHQEYATINDKCRRISQYSFLDLFEKGHVAHVDAPTLWDVDFHTAIALAEVEERNEAGAYHRITFGIDGTDQTVLVATTRPELLAACVAVMVHPVDERFSHLAGKTAVTPLFRVPVPIHASDLVDPEKGTGVVMVCTFGDQTDVLWWRSFNLPARVILGRNGRLMPMDFGEGGVLSHDAAKAAAAYGEITGKGVVGARQKIVELLGQEGSGPFGAGVALSGVEKITHPVKFYEKGSKPLEILISRQWFVKLVDKTEALLARGREIHWRPDHMRLRYEHWVEGLKLDWCVSRQRYFGVPIPVWFPLDDNAEPVFESPLLPTPDSLPVDPQAQPPPGYREDQRNMPGGFTGDPDVFDTWATSSLTPQVATGWMDAPDRHRNLFPMDIRPQSHEIIRTWAFYTIVKAHLHQNTIPWKNVLISGWILDPDRKKMSKSKGNVVTPLPLIEEFSADAVRYWAASARLGMDTAFDRGVLKNGKKLATKLFNAGKFVFGLTAKHDAKPAHITWEMDRALMHRLSALVRQVEERMEGFEFGLALADVERVFWGDFCDNYLELVKARAYGELGDEGRHSALSTLWFAMKTFLKLFAPTVPFISEEVWRWSHGGSVHAPGWPDADQLVQGVAAPTHNESFDLLCEVISRVRQKKTEQQKSQRWGVAALEVTGSDLVVDALCCVEADLLAAAGVQSTEAVTYVREREQHSPVVVVVLAEAVE